MSIVFLDRSEPRLERNERYYSVHFISMERPFTKPEANIYARHFEQIGFADKFAFHSLWLTEHHLSSVPYVPDVDGGYCVSSSAFALARAVPRMTKNIRNWGVGGQSSAALAPAAHG